MRCVHEASLYRDNSFITLTYADAHLPKHGSLKHSDFQKFLKRLRKHTGPTRVRFYMCGEYGTQTQRPHYHACLFNWDWPDKQHWRTTSQGHKAYKSELLAKLWPQGHSETGDVNFETAAYVARYCVQKVTGKAAEAHYGERTPDYNKMSLKPGIGAPWLNIYKTDVYPHDHVIVRGERMKPPKYYDTLLKREDRELMEKLKSDRELAALANEADNTPQRLAAKQQVAQARAKMLIRNEI